jgi:predicted PurR-regulated permease PerM
MAFAALVALATFAGALVLWSMRGAALVLFLAIATAASLSPLVDRLCARIPRPLAIAITYVAVVAVLFGVAYVVVPRLVAELGRAVEIATLALSRAQSEWPHGTPFERALARSLLPSLARSSESSYGGYLTVAHDALGATRTLLEVVGRSLLVLALSIYWSTSGERVERFWLSLLRPARRKRVRRVWKDVEQSVARALRRELGESLFALLVLGLGLRLLDVRFWAIAAVAAAILRLVPIVGVVLALPAVFAAALVDGVRSALFATVFALMVLVAEATLVRPRIAHPRGSAVLAVTTVLVLADVWGAMGMLLAIPVAAALEALVARLPRAEPARAPAPDLVEIQARYRKLRRVSQGASPEIAGLVDRLGDLIHRARRFTGEERRKEHRSEAGLERRSEAG